MDRFIAGCFQTQVCWSESEDTTQFKDSPISELNLTVRAENCLSCDYNMASEDWRLVTGGIKTIGQLVRLSRCDLATIRNCGKVTINEIVAALKDRGLSLRE